MQNIPAAVKPAAPAQEHRLWYQYYFHTERGRAGLDANRRALCRLLWTLWSPQWAFDDATFERSAASFDNPDFVAVTIQSYRHRYGYAAGDPALEPIERRLAAQPKIAVPTIALQGEADGVHPPDASEQPRGLFYRALSAPAAAEGRSQSAAGGAASRRRCRFGIDPLAALTFH